MSRSVGLGEILFFGPSQPRVLLFAACGATCYDRIGVEPALQTRKSLIRLSILQEKVFSARTTSPAFLCGKIAMRPRFYITTAIDYPNASPHMGHAYEKVVADAYARWYRLMDYDVYFLTGTDENGQKLVKAASSSNLTVKSFVDQNVETFRKLCAELDVSINDFIRTTDERHTRVVAEFWSKLASNDLVYFDQYSGHYCTACETFYLESQAPGLECPEHRTPLEAIEKDSYFLRTSKFQEWVQNFLETNVDSVWPNSVRKEILSRLKSEPLRDLSISRPATDWGIPVPDDPNHVIYTWFDALINYYAAVADSELENAWWPPAMHVIGRDIIWFHAVIWPIMLHGIGKAVPIQVYVHGMVLAEDGRRMSKSIGNGVDPFDVLSRRPVDSFRYYLLRAISSGLDGAFSEKELVARHNNELANDFGNLVMRVVKLSIARFGTEVAKETATCALDFESLRSMMHSQMERREHNRALDTLWEAIKATNTYLNAHEPWRIKDNREAVHQIMYNCLHAIYHFANVISPFLPQTGRKTLGILGISEDVSGKKAAFGELTFRLEVTEVLFPKVEE